MGKQKNMLTLYPAGKGSALPQTILHEVGVQMSREIGGNIIHENDNVENYVARFAFKYTLELLYNWLDIWGVLTNL